MVALAGLELARAPPPLHIAAASLLECQTPQPPALQPSPSQIILTGPDKTEAERHLFFVSFSELKAFGTFFNAV